MGDVRELGDDQWKWLNRFKYIQLNEWRLIVVGSDMDVCWKMGTAYWWWIFWTKCETVNESLFLLVGYLEKKTF